MKNMNLEKAAEYFADSIALFVEVLTTYDNDVAMHELINTSLEMVKRVCELEIKHEKNEVLKKIYKDKLNELDDLLNKVSMVS